MPIQYQNPMDMAGIFNAMRFAEQRKNAELQRQQMQMKMAQQQQAMDAVDVSRLLPEATAAAQRGDPRLLETLRANVAFGEGVQMLQQRGADAEKARFDAEKARADALKSGLEGDDKALAIGEKRATLAQNFAKAALGAISGDRVDEARLERIQKQAEKAGIDLPSDVNELNNLATVAGAYRIERETPSAELRVFRERRENESFDDYLKAREEAQEEAKLKRARAGAARFVLPGQNAEATGTTKTRLQETINAQEDAQIAFDRIKELDPSRFLGRKNRLYINALQGAARSGLDFASDATLATVNAVSDSPVTKEQALEDLADAREFDREIMRLFNQYKIAVTGAGASQQEMDDLRESYLNSNLSSVEFMRDLESFMKESIRVSNRSRRQLGEGFVTSTEPKAASSGAKSESKPKPSAAQVARYQELIASGLPPEEAAKKASQ